MAECGSRIQMGRGSPATFTRSRPRFMYVTIGQSIPRQPRHLLGGHRRDRIEEARQTSSWKSRCRRLLLHPIPLPTSTAVFCVDCFSSMVMVLNHWTISGRGAPACAPASAPSFIKIPWMWLGMKTNVSGSTASNFRPSSCHHSSTIRPAAFGSIKPFSTSPNKHARSWVQIVMKYAPGVA